MTDILIDTNILMHANNTKERTQPICVDLINYLVSSTEMICIDESIDINISMILHEYCENLKTPGTTGRNFIEKILKQKRFKPISRQVEHRVAKIINQHIDRNEHVDKIFVKITYKSNDKTFVSHDFKDFRDSKRVYFKSSLDINILTANDILRTINIQ